MKSAGIYIHIPFCKNKCNYCDYFSLTNMETEIPNFINLLLKEIKLVSEKNNLNFYINTIYFGGGSPSILNPLHISKILNKLYTCFRISQNPEITIELNPDQTNIKNFIDYQNMGINRLSLGIQSFDDAILNFLDREHTKNDSIKAYKQAREIGFKNINIDLLFNIPNQTLNHWMNDLKYAIKLNIEHISIYSLTLEHNTPLKNIIKEQSLQFPKNDIYLKMFENSREYLTKHSYLPYELTHFSKPNFECKHSLHYFDRKPYIGFGPSAHSFDGKKRWWNECSIEIYFKQLLSNKLPEKKFEILSDKDHYNEIIINGLRKTTGILKKDIVIKKIFDSDAFRNTVKKWGHYLDIDEKYIKLNNKGLSLTDEITTDFMY
tara:strand:+ start:2114 stop:3244 length:1131 start_codon:yes stop_codon:yes gene_type:complete